jgi:hypothetical protein
MSETVVWFTFRHDVIASDKKRYVCGTVHVRQPKMPKTGLWGMSEIDVWIPFPKSASMDKLREAAVAKALKNAGAFAKLKRSQIVFESEIPV